MSAEVVGFPGMTLERAREIVEYPDQFPGHVIITACKLLWREGTAADVRAVLDLQKAGIVAGFEMDMDKVAMDRGRALARRHNRSDALGFYLLFAAALGTVQLASWLFHTIKAVLP